MLRNCAEYTNFGFSPGASLLDGPASTTIRIAMRRFALIAGLAAVAASFLWPEAVTRRACAQQQGQSSQSQSSQEGAGQSSPDSQSKKPAPAKKDSSAPSSSSSSGAGSNQNKPSAEDSNPFPEDVSRAAAGEANASSSVDSGKTGKSGKAAEDNPFPESVSQAAARQADAGGQGSGDGGPRAEPGSSRSSSSSSSSSAPSSSFEDTESILNPNPPPGRLDPARAKEDTQVGAFYFGSGNYQGAFLRYKDAFAADPGSVQALFGMAESARLLGRIDEARRDYKLYLAIVPKGGESKKALKALESLPPG